MQRPLLRPLESSVVRRPLAARRPPPFPPFRTSGPTSPPSPAAVQLAMRCREEVETLINTTFNEYTVNSAKTSYPTPTSGDTSGTDYNIMVIVNTEVQACRFTGEAKYMQLIVYVDNMCNPSLKDVSFSA